MMQPTSEAKPPTTTTAEEAAHGHAEQAVQVRATTHVLEHVWQGVQEGVQVAQGRVLAHAHQAVKGAVQGAVPVVQVHVELIVVAQNEIIEHTNNSRM